MTARTRRGRAATAIEGARLADPLTGPRPGHVFDAESEPDFIEICNALGWAPWTGPRPDVDHYPLVTLNELAADAPPTLAIDMRSLLTEVA